MTESVAEAAKRGSLAHVQAALAAPGQDINRPDKDGCTALHHAVWRNHLPIIKLLLDAGAAMDTPDTESGWTALHRALYFGYLRAAALLFQRGLSPTSATTDFQGRTALDLLACDLAQLARPQHGEAFAWGHGANYQLGTGAIGFQSMPVRLEDLHGRRVVALAASKFHSAALTDDGVLLTWGFGRGGRLGHPEFDIHSGKSAVISPRPVDAFSRSRVRAISAAKHHTAAIVGAGELFTWGSNRDGRLGYPAIDSQPTPRRVGGLRGIAVACLAAANRHTAVATSDGRVFSWGSNLQGQLGYGTSDSASNATPRVVEVMKGKDVTAVAAAKRHTLVLTAAGEVYTWGHRGVSPRRVNLAGVRDVARSPVTAPPTATAGSWEVVFHRDKQQVVRPIAVAIAAGAAHSCVATSAGAVLAWRSMDPALQAVEADYVNFIPMVHGLNFPAASGEVGDPAGKYRTAVVTVQGEVFMWEGWSKAAEVPSSAERAASQLPNKQRLSKSPSLSLSSPHSGPGQPAEAAMPDPASSKGRHGKAAALADKGICPLRVEGIHQVAGVAVGEKHSLALQCWRHAPPIPSFPSEAGELTSPRLSECSVSTAERQEEQDLWSTAADAIAEGSDRGSPTTRHSDAPARVGRPAGSSAVPSLQRLCEVCVAACLVEPRTALQLLEFADAAGAQALFAHALEVVVNNLDVVLMEAHGVLESLPASLLATIERAVLLILGPRASASTSLPGDQEGGSVAAGTVGRVLRVPKLKATHHPALAGSFTGTQEDPEAALRARQVRTLRKKLQQIDALVQRAADSSELWLDPQQQAKVATRGALQAALDASESGASVQEVQTLMDAAQACPTPEPLVQKGFPDTLSPGSKATSRTSSSSHKKGKGSSSRKQLQPSQSCQPQGTPSQIGQLEAGVHITVDPWDDSEVAHPLPARSAPFTAEEPLEGDEAATRQRSWADMAGSWRRPEALQEPAAPSGRENQGGGPAPAKRVQRRGGLSLFLAGDLDHPPATVSPAPLPAPSPLPSWKSSIPAASLRHIQSQEAAAAAAAFRIQQEASPSAAPATGQDVDAGPGAANSNAIPLSQFMRKSAPIAVGRKAPSVVPPVQPAAEAKAAWGTAAPGSSPPGTNLRDIQAQQEQHRDSLSRSLGASGASPVARSSFMASKSPPWRGQAAAGMGASSPGPSFPSGTSPGSTRRTQGFSPAAPAPNKWYIQDQHAVAPLASIQTEESAAKQLELDTLYATIAEADEAAEAAKEADVPMQAADSSKRGRSSRHRRREGSRRSSSSSAQQQPQDGRQEDQQRHPAQYPRRRRHPQRQQHNHEQQQQQQRDKQQQQPPQHQHQQQQQEVPASAAPVS